MRMCVFPVREDGGCRSKVVDVIVKLVSHDFWLKNDGCVKKGMQKGVCFGCPSGLHFLESVV